MDTCVNYEGVDYYMVLTTLPSNPAKVIAIKHGVEGYFPQDHLTPENLPELPERVVEAFLIGSIMGWHVPGADPKNLFWIQ